MGCGNSSTNNDQRLYNTKNEEVYYQNISIDNSEYGPKEKVQVNIEIKNSISLIDYSTTLSMGYNKDESDLKVVGTTKEQQSSYQGIIHYDLSFILDYFFEKQQYLKFHIKRGIEVITLFTTLGRLMGSKGQCLSIPFPDKNKEELCLKAIPIKNSNISLNLIFTLKSIKNKSVFFIIKKKKGNKMEGYFNIYKSEVKSVNSNPIQYKEMKIPSVFFCNGDHDYPISIEFHNTSDKEIIGYYNTTVNNLIKKKGFKVDDLHINCEIELLTDYTFIDYLRGGTQLSLTIGIDFTGSNGHPYEQESLHRIGKENKPNNYQLAIRSCGDILAYYDYDQIFPVFGYGAILPGTTEASKCFPLTLTPNPNIHLIDEVLNVYRTQMPNLTFSGPTYFSPLIKQVLNDLKLQNDPKVYHILLILTDGMINDMEETIATLVDAASYPLSVIIVGIGKGDFFNMDLLDSDNGVLIDYNGRKSPRDLVQFVPFHKFSNNGVKLAEEVLAELPRQLVEYYRLIKKIPDAPII